MKILFLSTFSIFLLSAFDPADSSAHYDKILSHSRIRAREQGPNVCALQQVMGTKKKYFSTCRNWYQGAICGKKATVLYECCPGYMKLDGMRGCPAVAPIDHVYGTLGIVGATSTQRYSDMSKLREEIEGRGSFTFFSPSNDAWELLDREIHSNLVDNVNIELYNALHNHMVNKRMLTKDLKNGLTLVSMYNDQQLLINHYPNGVVTVNCARIIHGNQIATNGVVHVIDRVLTPVGNTIQEFLEAEDDLSSLRAAAITSGVLDTLGKPGHYTLFAPTNEAFEKLPRGVLERIMGDKVASEALMKFHILNTLQCSEAIMGGAVYETLEGSTIEVGCDGESLTVNGVKMINRKDIVTSNGVIHLIDHVLIPNSAKQVIELASDQQTTFIDLLAQLGLVSSLRPEGQYTLLAPLNGAFSDDTLRMDQRLLKLIMQNHILKVKIGLSELYNGQKVETLGGKRLRIFVYRTAVCIENSCMVRGSKEGRNGVIHIFRQIIKPAEKSLREVLKNDKRFSIFLNLVKEADLDDVLSQPGEWTLFVPTNEAFKGLTDEEKEILRRDKNALRTILLYHLTKGIYIGSGFEPGVTNILKTIQGSKLYLKTVNDTVLVNELKSKESDLMATNGVIHVIDQLLYPVDVPVGNDQLLTILNKMIKYIQIKFIHGSRFQEIPLTFFTSKFKVKPNIKVIEGSLQPITRKEEKPGRKITKVVGGATIRKVTQGTRIIEGEPETKLFREGETITKVIHGEPIIETYTKIIDGHPVEVTEKKVTEERIIQGPEIKYTRITAGGRGDTEEQLKKLLEEEVTKVTKFIEGDGHLLEDEEIKRLLQGAGTEYTKVTKVIEGEPLIIEREIKEVHLEDTAVRKPKPPKKAQGTPRRRTRLVRP
ncbi:periostin-like isoform X1 [Terrapene carolina triunguis]|uniref:periostin isoform X1 n=1 Tax=Terrapene triunguis TaxID=2587831 RepID=UPI000CEFA162|nr:periostin isoform X1 [Terrapene carolina triunguis]XP_026509240.1 periostin-like isoform X1 [Terrapene carolina triunguis]